MRLPAALLAACAFVQITSSPAQDDMDHSGHHGHAMTADAAGMVMNENRDRLPRDCSGISRDYEFTIHAGRDYAAEFPGQIFGMSQHEVRVQPCSRLTVTFINEDQVRHQWMVHGLPNYLYPAGMFHIEVAGGQRKTGTFIVPGDDRTYLVHCDMSQHMEKGMRGQLVVGDGSGDLWSVAGVSDDFYRFSYLPGYAFLVATLIFALAFLTTAGFLKRR
jgi:plastocyanin